jgi:DNA-binding winged helix-turn-helix (wHTH) protein
MKDPAGTIYAFDEYRLDPVRRILARATGEVVRLKPKALDTLIYLVEHPLELVEKEVLLREIWPNVTVEENNLNQHISALRRALGEAPAEHRFIVTEPRRGYRFVTPVEKCLPDTMATPAPAGPPTRPSAIHLEAATHRPRAWLFSSFALIGAMVIVLLLVDRLSIGTPDIGAGDATQPAPVASGLSTTSKEARDFYDSGMEYLSRRDQLGRELPIALRQFELSVAADPEFALAWSRLGMAHLAMMYAGMRTGDASPNEARLAVQRALTLNPELPEAHLAQAYVHFLMDNDPEAALKELEFAGMDAPADSEFWMARADLERRMGRLDQALASARRSTGNEAARLGFEASVEMFRRNFDRAESLLRQYLELFPDNAQTQRYLATIPLNRNGDSHGLAALARNADIDRRSQASSGWFAALWDGDREAAFAFLEQIPDDQEIRGFGTFDIAMPSAQAQTLRAFGERLPAEDLYRSVIEPTRTRLAGSPGSLPLLTRLGEALVGVGEVEAGLEIGTQVLEIADARHDVIITSIARLEIITRVLIPAGRYESAISELDRYLSEPGPWSIEGLMHHPLVRPIRDEPGFLDLADKHKRN